MTTTNNSADDPRTVDELVTAALAETDEEAAWNAVNALQRRGNTEVLRRAERLCDSRCSRERRLAADILGQLGVPGETYRVECCRLLRRLLTSGDDANVLRAALVGLSHQSDSETVPQIARFSTHPDPVVRHAAVLALTAHKVPLAIECLISLSKDPHELVRDWATFALGTLIELDTPAIRSALADRLDDPDYDTRTEALVGLARRNDRRVIDALKIELSSDRIGRLIIEAAELIASKDLHAQLVSLREWWDVDPELLEGAISASQP